MKKLVALIFAFAATAVFAKDNTGQLALGFQESFTTGIQGAASANPLGAWSIKYGISEKATAQLTVGFTTGSQSAVDERINFGARFLYDIVDNENSDFYTGVGILYDINENANPDDPIRINVPLGFEFSFAGLPEVGISAEAGLMVDIIDGDFAINSVGGNVGGALGLGVHYYF